jgi:hypothetical protein
VPEWQGFRGTEIDAASCELRAADPLGADRRPPTADRDNAYLSD